MIIFNFDIDSFWNICSSMVVGYRYDIIFQSDFTTNKHAKTDNTYNTYKGDTHLIDIEMYMTSPQLPISYRPTIISITFV